MEAVGEGGDPAPLPHLGLLLAVTSHSVAADQGIYSVTGQAATLRYARDFVSAQGAYSIAGQAATLTYSPRGQSGAPAPLPHLALLLDSASYAYTGTGGAQTPGAAAVATTKARAGSGGAQSSGSATVSTTKTPTVAGGLQTSGAAASAKIKAPSASGGAQSSGTASVSQTKAFTASGSISTGGAGLSSKTKAAIGSGSAQSSGAAETSLAPAGSPTEYEYSGSGFALLDGAAATSLTPAQVQQLIGGGGGVVRLRPIARMPQARQFAHVASGGIWAFGAAQVQWFAAPQPTKPVAVAKFEPAPIETQSAQEHEAVGSGSILVDGAAAVSLVRATAQVKPVADSAQTAKTVAKSRQWSAVASGSQHVGGSAQCGFEPGKAEPAEQAQAPEPKPAPVARTIEHEASGGARFTGSAASAFVAAAVEESKQVAQAVRSVFRFAGSGGLYASGVAATEFDADMLGLSEDELLMIIDLMMED